MYLIGSGTFSYTVHIHSDCTHTVLIHCAHTPYTNTVHKHCTHTLYTYTVHIHCAHTLHVHIHIHCTYTLCTYTVHKHCTHTLYTYTAVHVVGTYLLCSLVMWNLIKNCVSTVNHTIETSPDGVGVFVHTTNVAMQAKLMHILICIGELCISIFHQPVGPSLPTAGYTQSQGMHAALSTL